MPSVFNHDKLKRKSGSCLVSFKMPFVPLYFSFSPTILLRTIKFSLSLFLFLCFYDPLNILRFQLNQYLWKQWDAAALILKTSYYVIVVSWSHCNCFCGERKKERREKERRRKFWLFYDKLWKILDYDATMDISTFLRKENEIICLGDFRFNQTVANRILHSYVGQ